MYPPRSNVGKDRTAWKNGISIPTSTGCVSLRDNAGPLFGFRRQVQPVGGTGGSENAGQAKGMFPAHVGMNLTIGEFVLDALKSSFTIRLERVHAFVQNGELPCEILSDPHRP